MRRITAVLVLVALPGAVLAQGGPGNPPARTGGAVPQVLSPSVRAAIAGGESPPAAIAGIAPGIAPSVTPTLGGDTGGGTTGFVNSGGSLAGEARTPDEAGNGGLGTALRR